jgi:hypothetical protein
MTYPTNLLIPAPGILFLILRLDHVDDQSLAVSVSPGARTGRKPSSAVWG